MIPFDDVIMFLAQWGNRTQLVRHFKYLLSNNAFHFIGYAGKYPCLNVNLICVLAPLHIYKQWRLLFRLYSGTIISSVAYEWHAQIPDNSSDFFFNV